jgi:hypothetical protein
MVDKDFKGRKEWFTVDDSIPIPPEALDLSLRKVPEDFVLPHLQGNNLQSQSRSSVSDSDMETNEAARTGTKKKSSPKKK